MSLGLGFLSWRMGENDNPASQSCGITGIPQQALGPRQVGAQHRHLCHFLFLPAQIAMEVFNFCQASFAVDEWGVSELAFQAGSFPTQATSAQAVVWPLCIKTATKVKGSVPAN